jgi:transcriptional regulator with XRE-family HTH domain
MLGKITIVSSQCRAARALLDWSRGELSKKCSVSLATLADFEAGKREPYARTLLDIQTALESAGIEFLDNGATSQSGGAGVRLKVANDTNASSEAPISSDLSTQ